MARGLRWGLWRLLPLPLPLVTGSAPCLNLATVILQLVESEKHFQWLGIRGTHPSQFDTVYTFQVCCSDS